MLPICAQKQPKKTKKTQAPPLLKLGDNTIGTQKQHNRKPKAKKEGAQIPPMLKLCDGIHLH
jgi:hypothetical protein